MNAALRFELENADGPARAGRLHLPHGVVATPAFMPVGTQGTVRALSPLDLQDIGTQILLANTYHLHLRPGAEVVASLGGLHRFMAWDGPILTDSGGFQVFSLEGLREVTDEAVTFTSHVDGAIHRLTPERAVELQWQMGSDIAMALDHVVPGTAGRAAATEALDRTSRWLARSCERHRALAADHPGRQVLWPIVQGATYPDLRRLAAKRVLAVGSWSGIAIGGLAVGEGKADMYAVLEELEPALPPQLPRYLMGVGFPVDLLEGIARGIDVFDCVAPTRHGRNGSAFTSEGPLNIRNAAHRTNAAPLEEGCPCEACTRYARGYLRHLFMADELLGLRLLSLHNVSFLNRLAQQARERVRAGTFHTWRSMWIDRYQQRIAT